MKIAVFIGRFQPFHNGHKKVIEDALSVCDKIIIVIGSSYQPRSSRNPFTEMERMAMIHGAFDNSPKIQFVYSINRLYNDTAWATHIREQVASLTNKSDTIFLVGFSKDHSSYYLNMFPEWESIPVQPYQTTYGIAKILDATSVRQKLYQSYHSNWSWHDNLPVSTINVINQIDMHEIDSMIEEWKHLEKYKSQWKNVPYPVIFNTVDAVVTQAGHVLMVKRGAQPGKGLLALPGGFINEFETIEDAAIRELVEETRIDLPTAAIRGSIVNRKVFDSPYRSQRGRTITHSFHFSLDSKRKIPSVKGSDDAEKAMWIPLNVIRRQYVFEDHADQIEYFCGITID